MPLPVIGPGLGAFLGSLASNATNVALVRAQNRFQERMSSSAHQRQAEDLRKAGINPLLGAGGAGASSPVGTHATMEDSVTKGIHSGMAAKLQKKQLELLHAQVQREYSQAQLNNAENTRITTLTTPESNLLNARKALIDSETASIQKVLPLVGQKMASEIQHALASAKQASSSSELLSAEAVLKRLLEQGARNMSEAQKSAFMRHVAPYLNSAKDVAGIVGSVAGGAIAGGVAGGVVKAVGRGARSKKWLTPTEHYNEMLRNQAQHKRDMPSLYPD